MKEESDFESDYIKLRNIQDRELEALADRKTRLHIIKHRGIDYKNYYLTAGFFFYV
jgi:IS30 family transposase